MPVLPVTDRRRLFQQGAIMNPINRLTQSFQPSAGRGLLGAGLRGDRQRSRGHDHSHQRCHSGAGSVRDALASAADAATIEAVSPSASAAVATARVTTAERC